MKSKRCILLVRIVFCVFLAVGQIGCGGGAPAPVLIAITVTPTTATVAPGATAQFTATLTGDPRNAGADWNLTCTEVGSNAQQVGSSCGSLSSTHSASGAAVTYTAPTAGNLSVTIQAVPVTAGSVCCISASASVTVPGVGVTVNAASTTTLNVGASAQFTAMVTNDPSNKGVTWTVSCPTTSCGSVSPTTTASGAATTYTAPSTEFAGSLQVTLTATSFANSGASGQAVLTVEGVNVSVAPSSVSLQAAATQHFTATVTNDATNSGVTWSLMENGTACSPGCGSIAPTTTASGAATTYTAPATPPTGNTNVGVIATSIGVNAATGSAGLTLLAITIAVSPISALLPAGTTPQFTATVKNDPANAGVTWTLTQTSGPCTAATCGTLSSAAAIPVTYTAPATISASAAVTLTATSVTDTTKTATAMLNLATGTVEIIPDRIDFGREVQGGTTAAELVTLTNIASAALNVNGITITGTNAGDFSETNTCDPSVGAKSSCTISVTFKPTSTGTRSAEVSLSDSSKDSPQQVSLSGTGFTRAELIASTHSAMTGTIVTAAPSPTGPHSVGTRVLALTDSMRNDPYLINGTKRELAVRLWYPASLNQNCKPAEYTSSTVWNRFSQLTDTPLPHVTINSCLNASMTDGMHPVVVFTPGFTGTFTDYTFLFEDLASRGYVVASVAHTYETTAVELPDRGLVQGLFGSHLDGSWRGDEQIFSFATSVRLQDLTFVLNDLQQLNSDAASPLGNKLDMLRVAIAGHSMGGSTAILAIGEEPRFKAAVVIDGVLAHALNSSTETPVFLVTAGHEQWSYTERRVWEQLRGPRLIVNLKGAEHVTPSDEVWLARGAIRTGIMGPEKTVAALREYIAAFLDTNLLGKPAGPLLTGPSSEYPDVEVTTQNESLRRKP